MRHSYSEAPLLLLLRIHMLQAWRRIASLGDQSRLLVSLIGFFILGYVTLSFGLFYKALNFVAAFPGLGPLLMERLIYLLFASLFLLLLFSNLVIAYSNFFRNREALFLLSLPIPRETVFRWKFVESTLLASWAFLFLISPLLAAYGLTQNARWDFYAATVGLVFLFIILPAVGGAWLAINLARYMDRKLFQTTAMLAGATGLLAGCIWFRPDSITDEMLETRVISVLDRLLVRTEFSQFPFLPSYWLSAGVLNWAEGAILSAVFFALILFSYTLFFGFLAWAGMGKVFYEGISAVQSRGSILGRWTWFRAREAREFHVRTGLLDVLFRELPGMAPDTRALLVKDLRVFWRDTSQWGQTLVLFGLLGVYIMNLRHFSRELANPFWINLVSYLNLGACSLHLATLTTRFVYPQFSLEGKRLWIVGTAPVGLSRVLKIKFGLAFAATLIITVALMWLSSTMLLLSWERLVYFGLVIVIMVFTLNGLAAGLGAIYPNFKEDNPSKIVSGFGGTFCLVLSFLYIVASVIMLAFGASWSGNTIQSKMWLAGSWICFLSLSGLLGGYSFWRGLRRVEGFEI